MRKREVGHGTFIPADSRLLIKRHPFRGAIIEFEGGRKTYQNWCASEGVGLAEDDALIFNLAILRYFPHWSQHDCYTSIHKNDWRKILERWNRLAYASNFAEFAEIACAPYGGEGECEDERAAYIVEHGSFSLRRLFRKEGPLYENFGQWAESQFARGYKYLTIFGF